MKRRNQFCHSFMKTTIRNFVVSLVTHLRCSFLSQGVPSVHPKRCAALLRVALPFLAAISAGHAQTLPDLITYNFTVLETKTLPGTSAAPGLPCNGTIAAADQIGN